MDMKNSYWRFGAMIITSMIVMFGLMYLNTYAWEHVRWSETRFYMAFIMGAAMAVVMLSFMLNMYKDSRINFGIFIGAAVVFVLALWLVRSQSTVDDRSYMKAMIPHHSIAREHANRAFLKALVIKHVGQAVVGVPGRFKHLQERAANLERVAFPRLGCILDRLFRVRPVPDLCASLFLQDRGA